VPNINAATNDERIFAANRATGHIALSVAQSGGRTRRKSVHEDGSLRVRFPNTTASVLEAVTVNTGGGMTGGDRFAVEIALEAGARLMVGSAAAEKIYRSNGPDAEMTVALDLADGAEFSWLPQETILFDGARLSRRIDVDLTGSATLLMAEAVVLGRLASGEAMNRGSYSDRWRVRRDGKLIYADTARLDGDIAVRLGEAAVAAGGIAIATVLIAPAGDKLLAQKLEQVRAVSENFTGEVGISAWNGIAVARLCAKDGAALRHDLIAVLAALGQAVPRLWLS
jgi:urease accessory protein